MFSPCCLSACCLIYRMTLYSMCPPLSWPGLAVMSGQLASRADIHHRGSLILFSLLLLSG